MNELTTGLIVGAALAGLIVGYLLGYRGGAVAGELRALKARMAEHSSRRSSTKREPSSSLSDELRRTG